jgi:hypothetical protein
MICIPLCGRIIMLFEAGAMSIEPQYQRSVLTLKKG